MSEFKDRLKLVLAGPPRIKKVELARAVGVSGPAVTEWCSGATAKITGDNLLKTARYLGVSPDWLANGKGPMRPEKSQAGTSSVSALYGFNRNSVPLIKLSGIPRRYLETKFGALDLTNYPKAYTTLAVDENTFAFEASGDNMTSDTFPEGSIIIAQLGAQHKNNDYVVAEDSGMMFFCRYVAHGNDEYLSPINPRYPIKPLGDIKIVAVCLEMTKSLR